MVPALTQLPNAPITDPRFRSVFVTDLVCEGCRIINVEAYDDIGYDTLNTTVETFDRFTNDLNRTLLEHFDKISPDHRQMRINIYSGEYPVEYILTKDGKTF